MIPNWKSYSEDAFDHALGLPEYLARPTQAYLRAMAEKEKDDEFLGDVLGNLWDEVK